MRKKKSKLVRFDELQAQTAAVVMKQEMVS